MRHGSLFSGIGGFDLAAEWMGWENVFHCEWNEFGQKVLKYHFPNAESFNDITKTDFTKYANTIDILTGGFPCQPFSLAGKRKGTNDERYLWHEMLRAIREVKPKWVIAENVFGITNIDGGMVFEQVCLDLEAEGYEVQPFIIPAAAKNAPHRRDRCWFIAYSNSRGRCRKEGSGEYDLRRSERKEQDNNFEQTNKGLEQRCKDCNTTDTESKGLEGTGFQNRFADNVSNTECIRWDEVWNDNGEFEKSQQAKCRKEQFSRTDSTQGWWRKFPSQSPICSGDDGLPTKLDGITFSKWRNESIKAYGNAIVPQIAYELFKIIANETARTHY